MSDKKDLFEDPDSDDANQGPFGDPVEGVDPSYDPAVLATEFPDVERMDFHKRADKSIVIELVPVEGAELAIGEVDLPDVPGDTAALVAAVRAVLDAKIDTKLASAAAKALDFG